jgi:hypothetical protein
LVSIFTFFIDLIWYIANDDEESKLNNPSGLPKIEEEIVENSSIQKTLDNMISPAINRRDTSQVNHKPDNDATKKD